MKQQFKGSLTLNVAAREIVLHGIELTSDQVMLAYNATVGHVYHNFYADDPAQVVISSSIISASQYDSIASFSGLYSIFQDGIDKGGVLDITGGVATVVSSGSGYRSGIVNTSGGTRLVIDVNKSTTIRFAPFKDCDPHNDTDEVAVFYDDGVYLDELIKTESDETQTLLQTEFNETQTLLTGFKKEVKDESDDTQTTLQDEFNETQTLLTVFKNEVKTESDDTQTFLTQRLLTPVEGKLPTASSRAFGVEVGYSQAVENKPFFGPSKISQTRSDGSSFSTQIEYDNYGNVVSVSPLEKALWTFASGLSGTITGFRAVFTGAVNLLLGNTSTALTSNASSNHSPSSSTPTLSLFSPSSVTSITCGTSSPKLGGTIDVSSFPNLTSITCAGNGITKFQGYGSLTNLIEINLSNNELNQVGFETLSNKPGLRTLNFAATIANQYINWTGAFPDLSAITTLVTVNINNSSLTGSNLNLSALTNLTSLSIHANLLSGAFPILPTGANSKLITINLGQRITRFTGTPPLLTDHPACTSLAYSNNDVTGPIQDLSVRPTLTNFWCTGCLHTGNIPNLSSNTALAVFRVSGQRGTTKLTGFAGGTVSATLGDFWADSNQLPAAAVDAILAAFVAAGRVKTATNTCTLNLGGTGNAAPTGQGITDKATLESRGWTVTTN
jgi:hypothetical protein